MTKGGAKTHVADLFAAELTLAEAEPAPVDDDLPEGIVRLPIDPENMPSAADRP